MVDRDRQLDSVRRVLATWRDEARVVDQHVDARTLRRELVGEAANRGEAGEIGEGDVGGGLRLGGNEALRGLGAGAVAADHHYPHPALGEAQRRVEPDPGAGAGDDGDGAMAIGISG